MATITITLVDADPLPGEDAPAVVADVKMELSDDEEKQPPTPAMKYGVCFTRLYQSETLARMVPYYTGDMNEVPPVKE